MEPEIVTRAAWRMPVVAADKLRHVTVGPGMASEITAGLASLQSSLATFVNDAKGQWQAQTSALKSALTALQSAVKDLAASPGTSTAGQTRTALANVNTAARNLLAAVNPACPSPSPS
jgi:hypothetical protein